MRRAIILPICSLLLVAGLLAQTAVNVPRPEQRRKNNAPWPSSRKNTRKERARSSFQGSRRSRTRKLRFPIGRTDHDDRCPRIDRAARGRSAFFLEVFYRKHGYAKVKVKYVLESANRVRLEIDEGPLMTLRTVTFDGM